MTIPLHPSVEPLVGLVGTWTGYGHGEYPTIEPFDYEETVEFTHAGTPSLTYSQRTRNRSDGRPLHAESGFWRMAGPTSVELMVAHPTGIVEIAEGPMEGAVVRLRSTTVAGSSSAKDLTEIERDITIGVDSLRSALRMTAVGQPLTLHLTSELRRIG
jgi:hypothetical protein